ncbi:MAG: hypothetical protein GC150_03045 [Rhizobiales bacterium]|nr:hypothetical protein [Hyphomicrobiales bacterium]
MASTSKALGQLAICGAVAAIVGIGALATSGQPVAAKGETPSTTTTTIPEPCRQYAEGSEKQKRCIKRHTSQLSPEDIYAVGYWMAMRGEYADAVTTLKQAEHTNDPRVLTYIGFSMRKLGDVDGAFGYYARALSIDPNYVVAREYLGEAHLMKGDVVAALGELEQIKTICGTSCEEYTMLEKAIAEHRRQAS